MEQAITVGDVLTVLGILGGLALCVTVFLAFLSVIASGYRH